MPQSESVPEIGAQPVGFDDRAGAGQRIRALIRMNTTLLLREPGPVLSRFIMPLVLIAVLRPLYELALAGSGKDAGNRQIVAGMLVLFSMMALSIVGSAILTERSWRTWDRLRATPAASWELLVGKAVPAIGVLVIQQVLVLGFGALLFGLTIRTVGLLVVCVAVWVLALLCLGLALGAFARSHSELAVFYDVGSLVLTTLGGAIMPLSMMPHWMRAIAPISPGYWAMSAYRSALTSSVGHLSVALAVLAGLGVVCGWAATWRINRGWGRSELL